MLLATTYALDGRLELVGDPGHLLGGEELRQMEVAESMEMPDLLRIKLHVFSRAVTGLSLIHI